MTFIARCKFWVAIALFALVGQAAFAQDASFRRVQLAYGISLEVPNHWVVLSEDNRKNIGAAGEAMASNAGIDLPNPKKEQLLAINSKPSPVGAMIRVSSTSPPDYSQTDLKQITPLELAAVSTELQALFKRLEAAGGGVRVLEMQPARVEDFNGHSVLVMSYIRASAVGPSPWQVTQYKIPTPGRLIEITLSHRQSDAVIWRPILERVRRSVRF